MTVPLYDAFSADYDRFVDWEARLHFEIPFFQSIFAEHHVESVLDVGCGTGQHAIAFARLGLSVCAADLSRAMVARARANAAEQRVELDARQAGMGHLAETWSGPFDAVTCLGNTLPHATSECCLGAALMDMASLLDSGGVLVVQNRNFDRVLDQGQRFMPLEAHEDGRKAWLFVRFYDMDGADLAFHVLRMTKTDVGQWEMAHECTELRAWRWQELRGMLAGAGLSVLGAYGSYRGEPWDAEDSGDLIFVAMKE